MAHTTYDPYYQHHHHHRQQPPEYMYHHHSAAVETHIPPPYIYNAPPPTKFIPSNRRHINTLFVSGLPDDVLPREIHNLFCRRPGFDFCQLKFTGRGDQAVAFVTFFNHQSAVLALQALDGIEYDPEGGSILHIELAKSNSRRKRKSGSGPYFVIDNRKKAAYDAEEMSSEDGDNESNHSSQFGGLHFSSDDELYSEKNDVKKADLNDPEAAENKPTKESPRDLQPCSTLFIAKLSGKSSDEELKKALSQYPGFKGLKRRVKGPVAFVDYEEVEQATNAMEGLQGTTLPSSNKGRMVIQYARAKMR